MTKMSLRTARGMVPDATHNRGLKRKPHRTGESDELLQGWSDGERRGDGG